MKNSVIYLKIMTFVLITISYMSFARADFEFGGEFHSNSPDQFHAYEHSIPGQAYPGMQQPNGYPGMQQPYGKPGMQQPYGQPGMQQPYMHPDMQQPYGHPGMQQPYMHPDMQQPYGHPGMQQPYGHPGMQQPYGHPGMYGSMDTDHIEDHVKAQFKMTYPGASHDQWEAYWHHYKMQHGIH